MAKNMAKPDGPQMLCEVTCGAVILTTLHKHNCKQQLKMWSPCGLTGTTIWEKYRMQMLTLYIQYISYLLAILHNSINRLYHILRMRSPFVNPEMYQVKNMESRKNWSKRQQTPVIEENKR